MNGNDKTIRVEAQSHEYTKTFGCLEAQASFSYETVDVAEIFNEVESSYQSYKVGKEKNIMYETTGVAPINGDREKIRQVMVILLDNAIKYTPPDGRIHLKLWREDSTRDPYRHRYWPVGSYYSYCSFQPKL